VNAVQGQFYKNLQDIAVDVAVLREQTRGSSAAAVPRLGAALTDGADT
jgi:hypothetical protein